MRVLLEHQRLHALAGRLAAQVEAGAPASELMAELGELLEQHIRYEERQLFPLIERLSPDLEPPVARDPAGTESSVIVADLLDAEGEGPVWGAQSEDLNATLLVWGAGRSTPRHVNEERDVLIVVLAGSADVASEPGRRTLRTGQALLVPKGEPREIVAGDEGRSLPLGAPAAPAAADCARIIPAWPVARAVPQRHRGDDRDAVE